ncbi:homoserine kinase [Citricoccus sp. SGAir0253]|uniref:homoserine kinase n=1 Tax=Citricoccus sp. SGAir0253 TaxID=2567881 RepID=UPI0010CCCAEE|nr:homoserine kinase [Citricoccus sp. SGAir0253]QCU78424.1 homoserine kinase [Citricoccus sp. SGAir0253]
MPAAEPRTAGPAVPPGAPAGAGHGPGERRSVPAGLTVRVSVPATSANLGPGFDSMGLALDLRDEVVVTTVPTGFSARVEGEGAGSVPTDGSHLVIATLRDHLAARGWDVPGLELTATNRIPHGRGLGSSAAAHATAVLAADALLPAAERASASGLLDATSALEGHPDNVAPALTGGLSVSWEEEGAYRSVRMDVHPDVVPVVAIPEEPLSTETARGLLPPQVSHAVAAANAGRTALLVHALTVDPALLLPATRDWLHQDYREPAMPESVGLVHRLRERGLAAVVSGAGPTVMVLAAGDAAAGEAREALESALGGSAQRWRVRVLPVDTTGAKVEAHRAGEPAQG